MALDRFFTLYLFRPLLSLRKNRRTDRTLPVLMYHSISDDPESDKADYFKICTRPQRFRDHMEFLYKNGYRGVSLQEGLEELNTPKKADTQAVAITFDDGFRDFYTEAWPAMQKYEFTATMYLPTAYIGDATKSFKGKECLNWSEVRELDHGGIEFGSHTVNHPKLVELGWSEINKELTESKQCIEDKLGKPAHSFAYPYAYPQQDIEFAIRLTNMIEECGYGNCVTTQIGEVRPSDNRFQLNRLPANSADDDSLFGAKLTGAYDWLAKLQKAKKILGKKHAINKPTQDVC